MVKKFLTGIISLILIFTLSGCSLLSDCSLFGLLGNGQNENYSEVIRSNDTGELLHVVTDKSEVTLIPDYSVTVKTDAVKSGETPTFETKWANVTWKSENPDVATVNENGVITGKKAGSTVVYAVWIEGRVQKGINVTVIKKRLESISVENPKVNYLVGSAFNPSFTCIAHFKGGFDVEVTPDSVDSSAYKAVKGEYPITVFYSFDGVKKFTKYRVFVVSSITYEAEYLDYTYSDIKKNSPYSNTKFAYSPSSGDLNFLVIPVYFTDSFTYVPDKAKTKSDVTTAFFGDDVPATGWNSVKTFYEKESDGKLSITGKVSDWYEPNHDTAYFSTQNAINTLAIDAVDWFFTQNPTENRSDYDSDGNGTLDAIALIYACPDAKNSFFWGKVITAELEQPNLSAPTVGFFMWMSAISVYENEEMHIYPEDAPVDSHVFIHETGHFFKLEDYYDYGANDYRPAGGFTVQEHNTGSHDPFSCLALGWAKAIIPDDNCTIELQDFQSSHTVIILSPRWNEYNSPFDEYMIIELYSPTGLNAFDSAHPWKGYYPTGAERAGIRIWHVDARLAHAVELTKDGVEWELSATGNPDDSDIETAFTNSWGMEGRTSVLGSDYEDFALLFAIRNYEGETYLAKEKRRSNPELSNLLSDDMLFHTGDEFDIKDEKFAGQFKMNGKLNSGSELGWKVNVEFVGEDIGGYTATVKLTKTEE